MKLRNLLKNEKEWYLLRLTQEGARKYATIFNQILPEDNFSIVATIDTLSIDPIEIRNRDVVFHMYVSPKQLEILTEFIGDFIVECKKLED